MSRPRLLALAVSCTLCAPLPLASQELTVEGRSVETQADGPCWHGTARYVDCGNGTVTDTVTGLLWLEDPCSIATWAAASDFAVDVLADGLCGLSDGSQPGDWRLPTVAEWAATISRAVELGCTAAGPGSPPSLTNTAGTGCFAAGPQPFIGVDTRYWAVTLDDVSTERAWSVDLSTGRVEAVFEKNVGLGVWAVRSGR